MNNLLTATLAAHQAFPEFLAVDIQSLGGIRVLEVLIPRISYLATMEVATASHS